MLRDHRGGRWPPGTPSEATIESLTAAAWILAELQPELFAEISPELAAEIGVSNGDFVIVATARGEIEARALVSSRMPSLEVQGGRVHQVGLPYHCGGRGLVKGDVVNDLVAISEEPNVRIMEAKALTCSVRRSEPAQFGFSG